MTVLAYLVNKMRYHHAIVSSTCSCKEADKRVSQRMGSCNILHCNLPLLPASATMNKMTVCHEYFNIQVNEERYHCATALSTYMKLLEGFSCSLHHATAPALRFTHFTYSSYLELKVNTFITVLKFHRLIKGAGTAAIIAVVGCFLSRGF